MRLVLAVLLIGLYSGCKDDTRSNSEPDFALASIEPQDEPPEGSSPPQLALSHWRTRPKKMVRP